MILHTFWKRGDLHCVLVRHDGGRLSVEVFIRDHAFITDPCSTTDAADRAAKLLAIFSPSDTTA
jgi:hypothetical protein